MILRPVSIVVHILISGFARVGISTAATVDKIKFPYSAMSWNRLPCGTPESAAMLISGAAAAAMVPPPARPETMRAMDTMIEFIR
jgi:hypothetical protein